MKFSIIGNRVYLGGNQLFIRFENGTHVVRERYENYEVVFQGNYVECVRYCQKRFARYFEEHILF